MAQLIIRVKQGDADTFTETITGLDSLSGYSAEMYVYDEDDVLVANIEGSINGLDITYEFEDSTSSGLDVGIYDFETKIFDNAGHVYTPSTGRFIVESTHENSPS